MRLKNKIVIAIFCVFVAGFSLNSASFANASTPSLTSTNSLSVLSIEQLQQIVIDLQKQILQLMQLLTKKNTLIAKPVCGNEKCDAGETTAICPADCGVSACVKEGDFMSANETKKCCPGLIKKKSPATGATCPTFSTCPESFVYFCVKSINCGNGVCDTGETAATCSLDCNAEDNCVAEGQSVIAARLPGVDSTPVGPQVCCDGLTMYKNGGSEWVKNGACVRFDHSAMVGSYPCVKCGDGICNSAKNENICNCPSDCKPIVGGNCTYKSFQGTCVSTKDNSQGFGYMFEPANSPDISGTFLTSAPQIDPYYGEVSEDVAAKSGLDTTMEPTGMSSGKTISCTLKVIMTGTCTPIIITF